MTIIGFNFNKINVERKQEVAGGKIDIKNNVAIVGVDKSDISVGKSDSQKVAKFNFDVNYEPKIGSMLFNGEVLYLGETKVIEELVEQWKKDKTLPKEIMAGVINTVLNRSNIQALILSQQINLPPPIQMPKVQVENKNKKE